MSGTLSGPCPVCQQTTTAPGGQTPDSGCGTLLATAISRQSCQHRTIPSIDIRRDFDDWLEDSRLFGNRVCLVCRRYYPADTQFCTSDGTVLRDASSRSRTAPLVDGRLQLTSFLGSGSLTDVYGGTDLQTNMGVAVKILRRGLSHDNKLVASFLDEAERTRHLSHPNIATIYYSGTLPNGRPYMVTEYLPEYRSLNAVGQEGNVNLVRLLNILLAACSALEYAHRNGILHLYPSGSNITMCSLHSEETELVKVCDFGIAERLFRDLPVEQHASRTMGIFGSPLIISPEYCIGEPATEKSDVYGLACVVYLALARRPALGKNSALGTVMAHLQDQPEPFDQFLGVPPMLAETVFAGLSKKPAERLTIQEFRERLSRCLKNLTP